MPARCSDWVLTAAWVAFSALAANSAAAAEPVPAPAVDASAAEPTSSNPAALGGALNPDELIIFSLLLETLTLSEGLGAYGQPDDPLLPLGELARLLELDIDVFPAERRVTGRLGEARQALSIDLKTGSARSRGADVPLPAGSFAVSDTEIYARASTLRRLLPLTLRIDDADLSIHIIPTEKLPLQQRLSRMASRRAGQLQTVEEPVLALEAPYALFTPPSFDFALQAGYSSEDEDFQRRYDARFAGDLMYANYLGFLASDETGRLSAARLLLQRQSPEGRLLGPLKARHVAIGDTFSPALPLGVRSVSGRGVALSTAPLDQTNIFNRVDLRGELPAGFDVELYINDILRGSTNQSVNGRYEFLDVPLTPGVNVVRIVTFGPRGEREEETRILTVGGSRLRPGEATLSLGLVQQEELLLNVRRVETVPIVGSEPLYRGGLRLAGQLEFGLTDLTSATLGGALYDRTADERRAIYAAGLRTSFWRTALQFDAAGDSDGGRAFGLGAAASFGQVAAVFRHLEYSGGFNDENNYAVDPDRLLRRRSELTLDTALDLRGRIIPISLRGLRTLYVDGSEDLSGGARLSSTLGPFLASTGLQYDRRAIRRQSTVETLSGYIAASTFRSFRWQLRATLDYVLLPELEARFVSLIADRQITETLSLRFGLGQPLDDLGAYNLVAGASWLTRLGDLSLTAEYDNGAKDWRVSAGLNFGLGYDPYARGYRVTPSGPGSGGSAALNAFIDANADGVRQPDEAPAPRLAVQGGGRVRYATGDDGRAYLTGLGAGPTGRVGVDLQDLDAPNLKPPPAIVQTRTRPGHVARVDYALQPTGDLIAKVELLRPDGKRVGLSSVRLHLIPAKGDPIVASTEFDGSAVFSQLPLGTYRVALEPKQATQLRMRLTESPTVTIDAESFAPEVILEVQFEPPPDASTSHVNADPGARIGGR